ncbi:MAG: hypothetical protein HONBIEJF_01898 [Fimbriimonadaceae bacterium]|nr:hypothetical protein [Fimbriimonadaceae bacterium]
MPYNGTKPDTYAKDHSIWPGMVGIGDAAGLGNGDLVPTHKG